MSETKTSLKIVVIIGIALKAFSPSNKFVTAYTLAHICFRNGRLACIIQKNNTKEIFHILLQQIWIIQEILAMENKFVILVLIYIS